MNLRPKEPTWNVPAPAKLNLYLEVLGRRRDGFHELETLMVAVQLYDSLSFTPVAPKSNGQPGPIDLQVRLTSDLRRSISSAVPTGPENLVVRALERFRQRAGCDQGARVELVKRIPSAAGLGGGSSDAAAALKLANRAWGINWPHHQLEALAGELGSDVPFFLSHGAAICRGRGEQVEPIAGTMPLDIVIVKPPGGLSTADVYQKLAATTNPAGSDQNISRLTTALMRGNRTELAHWMGNRLQAAAELLSPWIERMRKAFTELDFLGHQLTGSGTAYFGLCRHAQHARRLGTTLRSRKLGLVLVTRTCR